MKTLKTLVLVKSLAAAAIATMSLAAPAISHASPDDGMVCRASYSAQFNGGNLKCKKTKVENAGLSCLHPTIKNPVTRVRNGTLSDGRDICTRAGITVLSNGSLDGLTLGQDYVFKALNPTKVAATRIAADRNEEQALSLTEADVDASASAGTVIVDGGFGGDDVVPVTVTLSTFAIPASSFARPDFGQISPFQPVVTLPSPRP
jgi:hypothetical protein